MGASEWHWRTMKQAPSEITEWRWPAPTNNNQQHPAMSNSIRCHTTISINILSSGGHITQPTSYFPNGKGLKITGETSWVLVGAFTTVVHNRSTSQYPQRTPAQFHLRLSTKTMVYLSSPQCTQRPATLQPGIISSLSDYDSRPDWILISRPLQLVWRRLWRSVWITEYEYVSSWMMPRGCS